MEHQEITGRWGVVIGAGGEPGPALSAAIGKQSKALAEIAGRPSIAYVADACRTAGFEHIALVGPDEVRSALVGDVLHAPPGRTMMLSFQAGASLLPQDLSILFLPGDSPLIRAAHLLDFIRGVEARLGTEEGEWFAAGIATKRSVESAFPGAPYRYLRLKEGRFASGALYAASQSGLRRAFELLEAAGNRRKSQLQMALRFGLPSAVAYAFGKLSLARAEERATRVLGGRAIIVPDSHPATTYDIDTVEEWEWLKINFDSLRLE